MTNIHYDPIHDIIENFIDIQEMYIPVETTKLDHPSVKVWLKQIKLMGYTDAMIHEIQLYITKLIIQGKKAEAALLLLVSASTQHPHAQYHLAQELKTSTILNENVGASFAIFSYLAENGSYEAVCDLAYFYHNGIAVKKNISHAQFLYKFASDAGIRRAGYAYAKLSKKKPFFNFFST